jgi:hypothetical protein
MTVSNSNNRTRLAVSGLTYDFTFAIDADTEILVYEITDDVAVLLTLTTDYTVSISTITEGGTVTLTGASSADEILMIRDKEYQQTADIPVRGGFNEAVIEGALDNLEMQIQQLKELIDFCVKQESTLVPVTVTIPIPEDGLALVWDGTSGSLMNAPIDAGAIADNLAASQAAQAAAEAAQAAAEAAQAAAVTAATFVGFSATKGGAQSISAGATTKIQYATEVFDIGSYYDNVTNYRFKPLVAGYYHICGSVSMVATAVDKRDTLYIYKNGSPYATQYFQNAISGEYCSAEVSQIIHFNGTTDYVEIFVYNGDSSARSTAAAEETYFYGSKVGV